MKKVCFFISSVELAGGTERVCSEVANKLAQLGWQVSILSMYGNNPFFPLRPEIRISCVYKVKQSLKFLPSTVFKIRNRLSVIKPEVIISVDSAMFVYAIASCWALNLKHLVWEHFNFSVSLGSRIRIIARRLAATYSTAIVTLTAGDQEKWRTTLNCRSRIITIPNPSPFRPQNEQSIERNDIVLACGRLTFQKGFDRLLDAWKLVTSSNGGDWKLHIVGSGEQEQMLKQKIESLGIATSVQLIPRTLSIENHYMEAGIFCLSSRFEGFPMVLLEAQSYGLPIVSYDCKTGPAELVHHDNGILVEDGNQQAMSDALLRLMNNKDLRTEMGRMSLKHALKYDIDIIVKQWTTLFNTM